MTHRPAQTCHTPADGAPYRLPLPTGRDGDADSYLGDGNGDSYLGDSDFDGIHDSDGRDDYDSDNDEASGRVLQRLPTELLCHVARFLGLDELACVAGACRALYAVVAAELHGERKARERLALARPRKPRAIGADRAAYDALGVRISADACRRWGLSSERPFAALARRAAVRLVATSPPFTGATWSRGGEKLAEGNRSFGEREAPARDSVVPHRRTLPVLLPGETLWFRDSRGEDLLVQVDPGHELLGFRTIDGGRIVLCIPIRVRTRGGTRVVVSVEVEAPCDDDVYAALLSHGPGRHVTLSRAHARYAAMLCETWSAPQDSVRPVQCGEIRWSMSAAARNAARSYYDRAGIPLAGLTLRMN